MPSPIIDPAALSRALDAFCEAYGHNITWSEVLPILRAASSVDMTPRVASRYAHRFEEDSWPR